MLLYQYDVNIKDTVLRREERSDGEVGDDRYLPFGFDEQHDKRKRQAAEINKELDLRYRENKKCYILLVDLAEDAAAVLVAYAAERMTEETALQCLYEILPGCRILKRTELSVEEFASQVSNGCAHDLINKSGRNILEELGLFFNIGFFEMPPFVIKESVYPSAAITLIACRRKAERIMASESFLEEIDRIYSKKNEKKYYGHPVHYLISAGDYDAAMDMVDILIPALLHNKRLLGGRVMQMRGIKERAHRDERFEKFFAAGSCGAVIVDFSGEHENGNYASGYEDVASNIGKMLEKYGKDTLFILVDVARRSEITGDAIRAIQSHADMVHLTEGYGDHKRAVAYMKKIARRAEFSYKSTKELTKYLPEKASYTVSDIYEAYNLWYAKGLKSHVYTAYAEVDTVKLRVENKEDKPYEALQKMVGLEEIKGVCDQILCTAKLDKMKSRMGYTESPMPLHMLFSGNPGTAKTTVARLLAQILKEEGVLDSGHFVECGRQDLVARYVGWTAKTVKEKFREARGGVLFIDEAYALVDDTNSFGTEAINTIVQQMENYRNEVIVIFAGYPDKMKEFLAQNEGLNSRIAFHLHFPDYSETELAEIMALMLAKDGYHISESGRERCLEIFRAARRRENFGNGRFVRNVVEQARMRQACRIMGGFDGETIGKDVVSELLPVDITEPYTADTESFRVIGF